jgi:molecular chaperone GrpE
MEHKDPTIEQETTQSESDQAQFDENQDPENVNEENQSNTSDTNQDQAQQEIAELKDKYMRLYAEFDNFKRRTAKEKIDLISTASKDTIAALLPVVDDFDRAKKTADDPESTETFSEGVKLVYDKLHKILAQKGLLKMESNGEAFDPEYHEAITEIPAPTEELKGKVIDTIEAGYFLNDKIIRYAKVVVGK